MPATNLLAPAGQTFIAPSSLTQSSGTIFATIFGAAMSVAVPSLTAGSMYYVYMLNGALQVSASVSSSYRTSNPGALLVGAFLADSNAAFGSFVNIEGKPATANTITFTGTNGGGLGTLTGVGFITNRDGHYLVCDFRFSTGTVSASNALLPLPTNLNIDTTAISSNIQFLGTCLNNSNVGETRMICQTSLTTNNLYFNTANNLNGTPMLGNASPFATGQIQSGQYRVPISGWSNVPLKDL